MAQFQSPVLESLFRTGSFQSDLLRTAELPAETLDAILGAFRDAAPPTDEPYSESDISQIAEASGVSAAVIRRAFVLLAYMSSLLADGRVKMSELSNDILTALQGKVVDPGPFLERLPRLDNIKTLIALINDRRLALSQGVKRLSEFSLSCDLRIRTAAGGPSEEEDVETYNVQILELIPVVNFRLVSDGGESQTEFVAQLTAPELRQLIRELEIAEKQLQAAAASVALQQPTVS